MSSDRAIIDAANVAQNFIETKFIPRHNLSGPAFALRAVERVLCDHLRPHRETLNLLWDVLDDPHLNRALGSPTVLGRIVKRL
jgi:hypothetical protein